MTAEMDKLTTGIVDLVTHRGDDPLLFTRLWWRIDDYVGMEAARAMDRICDVIRRVRDEYRETGPEFRNPADVLDDLLKTIDS